MSSFIRTFVAVPVDAEVQKALGRVVRELAAGAGKVKWVEPENLHFTLKFLGDVRMNDVPAVCQAVAEGCREHAPFEIEVGSIGAFPADDRPRTVWVGVNGGASAMQALQASIEERLLAIGFRREGRAYEPHLTIGRVRENPRGNSLPELLRQYRDFAAGAMVVSQVVVFSSELRTEGPVYGVLATTEL
ncbi:MAG: RNA 2',3'-cyclic phosphodiesterase [Planctomycetia bacterium]|nr:RNA 2',3'-cyclic phosphodiesterase [Planctomycetia bacterium]